MDVIITHSLPSILTLFEMTNLLSSFLDHLRSTTNTEMELPSHKLSKHSTTMEVSQDSTEEFYPHLFRDHSLDSEIQPPTQEC